MASPASERSPHPTGSYAPDRDCADVTSVWHDFAPGALALASAAPVAVALDVLNRRVARSEGLANPVVLVLGILLLVPALLYIAARGRSTCPRTLGLILSATTSVLLVSIYLYRVSFYVAFPADILIWSESDFVNDIVKLRTGYPLYTAQQNNESFVYMPGAQALTYLLAWAVGAATSIPTYRAIQIGYTLVTAFVAMLCGRRVIEMSKRTRRVSRGAWGAVWLPMFFLMASNSLTNPFAHNLHNAALGQLVSITAYWLLLRYMATDDRRALVPMTAVPAVGYLIRQDLAIWGLLYCAYLTVERRLPLRALAMFTLTAFGGIAAVIGIGYLLWGKDFVFWTVTVPSYDTRSVVRGVSLLLRASPYLAIGLFGGLVLIRGRNLQKLLPAWLIWLGLLLSEAYTSSIAWMLHHLGPGSLIAGVWFMAAVAALWPPAVAPDPDTRRPAGAWLKMATATAVLLLVCKGLGIVRPPWPAFSPDAYRYVAEIEREFAGQPADSVLLDVGSWLYLKAGVVMKDRAANLGNRGLEGIADFSGVVRRIEQRRYAKILVRDPYAPDFWYDHHLWPQSSTIRQQLREHYCEAGRILRIAPARGGGATDAADRAPIGRGYLARDISILVPRTHADVPDRDCWR